MDTVICSRLINAADGFLQRQLHILLCVKTLSHLMASWEWNWAGSPAAPPAQQLCVHKWLPCGIAHFTRCAAREHCSA